MGLHKALRKANNTTTLLSKLYLSFTLILIVFSFVTYTYVRQSESTKQDIRSVDASTEVLRLAEGLGKAAVNSETGLRGFQVTEDSAFLAPYFTGQQEFQEKMTELQGLVANKEQLLLLSRIDSIYRSWNYRFAAISIKLQSAALISPDNKGAYNDFLVNNIKKGEGKKKMDLLRQYLSVFSERERVLKDTRLNQLNASILFNNTLAISLTILCVLAGALIAVLVGRTFKRRLHEIASMAAEISQGNFDVKISTEREDEISKVTNSLNIMADQLHNSFSNLNKLNNELDQFAYVVSHDLKAPLRAINNLAEWIEDDLPEVDPETKRNLTLMRGRVQRMENLINGILTYARIGRKEVSSETFSVTSLIDEITDFLDLTDKQIIHIDTALPEVTTERILLQQVFSNLISNAIKYNDKQTPQVNIGCHSTQSNYEFYVQDNGPGIPEEFHEKVFGVFQTMEARDTKESTGIGLAIVKKIVLEKGGEVWISTERGEGSRFNFTWPWQLNPVEEINV